MKCMFPQNKLKVIKILEWVLFLVFFGVAVYFAQGVVRHFIDEKTSFSIDEEKLTEYPVVTMIFPYQASEVNLTNVEITYETTNPNPSKMRKHSRKMFQEQGGTFGRSLPLLVEHREGKHDRSGISYTYH